MTDVTRILAAVGAGDRQAAADLLPVVYAELRRLAAARLAAEPAGQTLQPTALVHEAYLRLVAAGDADRWDGRAHFFAAAAHAMRRILVENARRKRGPTSGGGRRRCELGDVPDAAPVPADDLLALDDALTRLEAAHPRAAEVVKLRFFAGRTLEEAAAALGVSPRTADADWAYARAWLLADMGETG